MTHTINTDKTVAVAIDYYWQPMDTCPRGVKVQLLTLGGIAVYGIYTGGNGKYFSQWAPLPKIPHN